MDQNRTPLLDAVAAYARREPAYFKIPAHRFERGISPRWRKWTGDRIFRFDLTEAEGLDDLHCAEGVIRQAQELAAELYGARKTWFLVNGTTCGNEAMILAACREGDKILVPRNAHKSVLMGLTLSGARPVYLMPKQQEDRGISGGITPRQVEEGLRQHPDCRCVFLVSPTYYGVLSNIREIARICHEHDALLLVDEAHGAHYLPFAEPLGWRGGAVAAGADLVVQSAHKTLPSLTQTAWLHRNGTLVDPAAVDRQLDVFETSSPSYPLLVSLDGCTGWLRENGPAAFAAWRARLDRFAAAARRWHNTPVLGLGPERRDFFAFDDGKILLRIGAAGAAQLRAAGFEPEMVCGPNVLAMTSHCDDGDALDRLADWLGERDAAAPPPPRAGALLPAPGPARCTIAEALDRPAATMPLAEAVGKTAAEYVWAYPPGVPLVAPGEQVTDAFVEAAGALTAAGTTLHHSGGGGAGRLAVLA